jgi:hypothetical protein
LLGASVLLTFFAYFAVRFDQGHGWGYRYFHSAWGTLPILAALGVARLSSAGNVLTVRLVAALCLLSLTVGNGLRFAQVGEFVGQHLGHFPPRISSERSVYVHNWRGYYAVDLIQNDPWLRGRDVVISDEFAGDAEKALRYFPTAREVARNAYGISYTVPAATPVD